MTTETLITVRNCVDKLKPHLNKIFNDFKQYTFKFKTDITIEDVVMSDFYITFTTDNYDELCENKLTIVNSNDKITYTTGEIFAFDYKRPIVEFTQEDSKINMISKKPVDTQSNSQSDTQSDTQSDLKSETTDGVILENTSGTITGTSNGTEQRFNPLNKLLSIIRDILVYDVPMFKKSLCEGHMDKKKQLIEYYNIKFDINQTINSPDHIKLIAIYEKLFKLVKAQDTTVPLSENNLKILNLYSTVKNILINKLNTLKLLCIAGVLKPSILPIIELKKDAIKAINQRTENAVNAFNEFIKNMGNDTEEIKAVLAKTVDSNYDNALQSYYNNDFYNVISVVQDIEITYDFDIIAYPTVIYNHLKKVYENRCTQIKELFKQDHHCVEYIDTDDTPKLIIVKRDKLMECLKVATKDYHKYIRRVPGETVRFNPSISYNVSIEYLAETFLDKCVGIPSMDDAIKTINNSTRQGLLAH